MRCATGKECYEHEWRAKRAARQIRLGKGWKMTPYRCLICDYWHLATKTAMPYRRHPRVRRPRRSRPPAG